MREEILSIKNEALAQIMDAQTSEDIENLRIKYLGRQGKIAGYSKQLRELELDERKTVGRLVNEIKDAVENAITEQYNALTSKINNQKGWFDPTIPGIKPKVGHLHLVTQAIEEISKTFERIGFIRVRYPEVEWDWFAFESLNMPKNHPARDEWETFFIDSKAHPKFGQMVLTPHTSSGQVREMLRVKTPPIRMINIAKCYRRQTDVSHVPMFHQFEGLVVDKGIAITHLKGTLDYFARNFFGPDRKTRLRPYHFQFTEPSFEVDISCGICGGKGVLSKGVKCKLCKEGWLELGGAGMVHPVVLRNGGIDPKEYSGFAFGWGVERTFMMKGGINIPDIRLIYSTDMKYLTQF